MAWIDYDFGMDLLYDYVMDLLHDYVMDSLYDLSIYQSTVVAILRTVWLQSCRSTFVCIAQCGVVLAQSAIHSAKTECGQTNE